MNHRENLLRLYRRDGYEFVPVYFVLCPALERAFRERYPDAESLARQFDFSADVITDPAFPWIAEIPDFVPRREWDRGKYFDSPIKEGARIDIWGVVHEPGSEACQHMTQMRHPLAKMTESAQMKGYPWPDFRNADWSYLDEQIAAIHHAGRAAHVWMECTIWETAWYLRGMENLMMDMSTHDEKAYFLLDLLTDLACFRAKVFARAGADIIALGDDVGMQQSIMMSLPMYREWLKPRLKAVIDAARSVNPDVMIQYHSCGYIEPLIGDLIEAGIDVLDPVQPECMDFEKLHHNFGDRLSFHGTLGTQSTMPYGTADEVYRTVQQNLRTAGSRGGLFCCPTHMLEPEVPWENIEAYVAACREFTP